MKMKEYITKISTPNRFLILGLLSIVLHALSLLRIGWTFDQVMLKDWPPPLVLLGYLFIQKSYENYPDFQNSKSLMILDTLVPIAAMVALKSTIWTVLFVILLFARIFRMGYGSKWIKYIQPVFVVGCIAIMVWLVVTYNPRLSISCFTAPAVQLSTLSAALMMASALLNLKEDQDETGVELIFMIQSFLRILCPVWNMIAFLTLQSILLNIALVALHYIQLRAEDRKEVSCGSEA